MQNQGKLNSRQKHKTIAKAVRIPVADLTELSTSWVFYQNEKTAQLSYLFVVHGLRICKLRLTFSAAIVRPLFELSINGSRKHLS